MPTETRSMLCEECDCRRKFTRPGVNHLLHVVLVVLTAGLWLPIWLIAIISNRPWRCDECGSLSKAAANRQMVTALIAGAAVSAAIVLAFILFVLL